MNKEATMSKQKMKACTGEIENICRRQEVLKTKQLNYQMMRMNPKLRT